MENIIYSWSFNDNKEKGKTWYIVAISIVLALAIWGVFMGQYGLSFIIVFIAGIYFFAESNSSDIIEVLVSEVGIRIDKTFYEYPKIESFSVVYSGEKMVYLRLFLKKQAIGKIDLDINNEIGMALKEILPNFVAETENSSLTATEKIIGVLKL